MASSKIKGITIEIGGDTTKLGQALEGVEKQTKNLQTELRGVNSLLKLDPKNVELLKQKQDLLKQSISETTEKQTLLKRTLNEIDSGKVKATEDQYRDLQREIASTDIKLDKLNKEMKNFGTVGVQQAKAVADEMKEVGSKVEETGKKFSGISTVAGAGLGLATTSAISLEGAVNRYITATGTATEKTENYEEVLKRIHDNNYGESYEDIANKMAMVKQNFGDISETDLQSITEGAYMLEDAFGMDFNETLRGINGLMTNMGLTSEEAFDLMITGAQNGLNKSDELGDNIAEYSQLWGQAGFSATEMFTILQNGLDSGAYNLDKVNDLVKEMGISLTDGRIEENLGSFSKGTQTLFKEWQNGGASQSEVIKSMINDLANMEDEQDALTLASTVWSALGEDNAMAIITSLNDVNTTYQDTTGSIQEATETMYGGTGAKAQESIRKIKTAFAELGTALLPILTPIIEAVANLATKFANLSPTVQKIILVVGGIVTALGPLLIFVGKIISAVSTIIPIAVKIGGFLSKAVPLIKTLMGVLTGPIGIIIAIVSALVLLYNKCEWFRDLVNGIFEGIISAIKWVGEILATAGTWIYENVLKPIIDFYIGFYTTVFEGIVTAIKWVGSILKTVATWIYDNVIKPIIVIVLALGTLLYEGVMKVWNFIVGILKTVATWIYENVIKPVIDFFTACYETIKNAFVTAWNFIKGIFNTVAKWINDNVIKPVVNFFTGLWNSVKNIFGSVKTFFTDKFKQAYEGIKSVFSGVKDWFKKNVWDKVTGVFSGAWDKMKEIGTKIWDGLKSAFKNPLGLKVTYEQASGWKGKIVDALGLDGWPKLSFAKDGAVLTSPTPLLAGEYPNAVHNPEIVTPQKIMRETMMDALSNFTGQSADRSSALRSDNSRLTALLEEYLPLIEKNIGQSIVLDDGTLVGKITPKIDKSLGDLASKKARGY